MRANEEGFETVTDALTAPVRGRAPEERRRGPSVVRGEEPDRRDVASPAPGRLLKAAALPARRRAAATMHLIMMATM